MFIEMSDWESDASIGGGGGGVSDPFGFSSTALGIVRLYV